MSLETAPPVGARRIRNPVAPGTFFLRLELLTWTCSSLRCYWPRQKAFIGLYEVLIHKHVLPQIYIELAPMLVGCMSSLHQACGTVELQ
jgi:hypothetical protein